LYGGLAILLMVLVIGTVLGVVLGSTNRNQDDSTTPSLVSPTASPTSSYRAFESTAELYDAVELYVNLTSSGNLTAESPLSIQYGYPIGAWSVSRLVNFSRVFDPDRTQVLDSNREPNIFSDFNEDLSGWDMSNAETLAGMFAANNEFLGLGLDAWDTSRVTDFSFVFLYAAKMNQSLASWDTSSATFMDGMFLEASVFNGDLTNFIMTKVESTAYMFQGAVSFAAEDLSMWDMSNVENMNSMFESANLFNGDVSTWNTSKVYDMSDLVRAVCVI
jgi:Mycoplasma protein of unknown function, DUF285